ncbi:MAG: hypothetical protein CSA42_07320 [Gammaproteobacteria bacterium]|nr:MAG: hypothetical protein CSA42_07320 [Gammaproteobacteria bacterium]
MILKTDNLSPHYQIEIHHTGNMDSLTVNVEIASDDLGQDVRDLAAKELRHHIKSIVGVSTDINVKPEGGVARSQGKAQRVVDLR